MEDHTANKSGVIAAVAKHMLSAFTSVILRVRAPPPLPTYNVLIPYGCEGENQEVEQAPFKRKKEQLALQNKMKKRKLVQELVQCWVPEIQRQLLSMVLNKPDGTPPTENDCENSLYQIRQIFHSPVEDVKNIENKKNASAFLAAGGVCLVVSVMRKWPNSVDVQGFASSCLAETGYWSGETNLEVLGANLEVLGAMTESGAWEAVVRSMAAFPSNNWVQVAGLCALQFCFPATNRDVAFHIANELDGITIFVAAMKTFPNDIELQARACALMWKLAHHDELKKQLLQRGVLRLLFDAIDNDTQDATISPVFFEHLQYCGRQALFMLFDKVATSQ